MVFHPDRPGLCCKRNTCCNFVPVISRVIKHTRTLLVAWQNAGRVAKARLMTIQCEQGDLPICLQKHILRSWKDDIKR